MKKQIPVHNQILKYPSQIVTFKQLKNHLILWLLRLFNLFFPRRFIFNPEAPKILLVATTALGDSIWLTPLLPAIKKRYPFSYVAVLCSPLGQPVFLNQPGVDELFVLKGHSSWSILKWVPTLRRRRFQATLLSHASQRMIPALIFLTGAQQRIAINNRSCKGLENLMTVQFNLNMRPTKLLCSVLKGAEK